MKNLLVACGLVCSGLLYSQTTLTQAFNEPKPGDIESYYFLDTSAYASGLPNVSGNNAVWNFTNLKASQPLINNNYLSAASVSTSANYPGSTFVQESSGVYSYFKSTTTPTAQTEILGIQTSTLSANFTNSGIIAKYPVSFGSSSTDNMSGTFTFSVNGTCSGNITTNADGQGTLNLPGGLTLTQVLRVKSVQTLTLTFLFQQVGVVRQTIYNYYHASQKFPVLSINYNYISSALTSTPSLVGTVTGNNNFFVTGINEHKLDDSQLAVYPNPAQDKLHVTLNGNLSVTNISIYNQLGERVVNAGAVNTLSLSTLKAGIYLVEVTTDHGVVCKKIVKE